MTQWRVEVTWQTPTPLPNEAVLALTEAADGEHGWFVARWAGGDGVEISHYLQAVSAPAAAIQFADQVLRWMLSGELARRLAKRGMAGSIVAVRACTPAVFEREVAAPSTRRPG